MGWPVLSTRLLVGVGLLGVLGQEEVEVGLADDARVIGHLVEVAQRLVDEEKAALAVFEVDAVRRRVHEGHEQMVVDLGHWRDAVWRRGLSNLAGCQATMS
ncbi:MAG: hypothetical protein WDO13_11175 [Verrucomicrobiota bacterium]